jgi:hypothetical protein
VKDYSDRGEAQVAEVTYGDWRLIVRRTRLSDPEQLALWPNWRHHCFLTNRTVPLETADIDHRDHATGAPMTRNRHHARTGGSSVSMSTRATAARGSPARR